MKLQLSLRYRLRLGVVGLVLAGSLLSLLLAACGQKPFEGMDWYIMFDKDFGVVMDASPPYYTTEDTIAVTVTVIPKNSGVGHFGIGGTGPAGGLLGEVLSPVTGEFGSLTAPVEFEAGKEASMTWRVKIYPLDRIDSARLTLDAGFDSVVIDSTMYSIHAPEVTYQFGSGFIHAVSGMLWLKAPE